MTMSRSSYDRSEPPTDLAPLLTEHATRSQAALTGMVKGLVGSEILKIAADVAALIRGGQKVCNLTVGDFAPAQFPIPQAMLDGVKAALDAGQTNYPPSSGILELREAVADFYAARLGLRYPVESVLVAGGARPLIYSVYRALVEPGDVVLYGVPSWNNNHYAYINGAQAVELKCLAEDGFMPTVEALSPHLSKAALLFLTSPLNPTGTMLERGAREGICEAVLAENARRSRTGDKPLFVVFDQVYWMLTFHGHEHACPPQVAAELAPYTVLIDAISKSFAATGLRVGYAFGPPKVIGRMAALVGHMGAWAPRAEQVATTGLLRDGAAVDSFLAEMLPAVYARLSALHEGLKALHARGHRVSSIEPQGAIYLTARFELEGLTTPGGAVMKTDEDVRRYLLEAAGVAVVPFRAFGYPGDDGWMRLSVGAVSMADVDGALGRLGTALDALT